MNTVRKQDLKNIAENIPLEFCEDKVFLITGASGFLGSYFVDTLMYLNDKCLKSKCTIIALCRNKAKAIEKFQEYLGSPFFKLLVQSVEEKADIEGKVDYIIHAASSAVTSEFECIPGKILSANIIGTYNFLELARIKKVKGFLFLSSGAVYGEISDEIVDVKENDCFILNYMETRNCYAEGKRAGEAFCVAYWKQYKIPSKIVRISHTYGPGINLNDGRVFSDFVNSICKGENLVIRGSGNDVRPFCYVSDAMKAFFLILFHGKCGEAYNMANRKETWTIKELAYKLTEQAFKSRGLNVICKTPESVFYINKPMVNTDKLENLGWFPQVDVIEGFQRTVRSFEEK